MNWTMLSYVLIVIIGVFTVVIVECRWYQSGLVFYDISTKQMILPPTVSIHRARSMQFTNMPIFSSLGKPCTCEGLKCGCCAGLEVREYNYNQKMCANVTFVPQKEEALLDVYLNEISKARYGVSARNPSPICVPIMMPIPMAACIQMTQVGLKGDNLHMCMDFVMRLHTTDAMELHFNCLSMGLDGLQYLDPNGNPVLPRIEETEDDSANSIDDDEYYDTSEEEAQEDDENKINDGEEEEEEEDRTEGNLNDEESSYEQDDNANAVQNESESEYYEDEEELNDDNKALDKMTKPVLQQSNSVEVSTNKNVVKENNLIVVYETE